MIFGLQIYFIESGTGYDVKSNDTHDHSKVAKSLQPLIMTMYILCFFYLRIKTLLFGSSNHVGKQIPFCTV